MSKEVVAQGISLLNTLLQFVRDAGLDWDRDVSPMLSRAFAENRGLSTADMAWLAGRAGVALDALQAEIAKAKAEGR